ncbi:acetate uptake transporter [Archaeoglobus neptunius]|uniref:acetate uptake transporter n=1 Tax=Archaeoglobus neptunius TaxID=2798580 RepID=UPI001927405D|nr:acetate uptake transporter [Archaeoglobus neptunius]
MTEREYELKSAFEEVGMYKEWWANPAVVGLMGFALTTMATGLYHMGMWGAGPTLALAIAFGGTAQFIAGVIDFRKGSIFGGSAFCSYGAFWWAVFVLAYLLPSTGVTVTAADEFGFFLMWTLFTFAFLIASPKVGKYLSALFFLLFIAFALLTIFTFGLSKGMDMAGFRVGMGLEIFITGLLAWYIAMAELVNTVNGRDVLPLS